MTSESDLAMGKAPDKLSTRIAGALICVALLAIAGTVSSFHPLTVVRLTRTSNRQVDGELTKYVLFFFPVGKSQVTDVKDVVAQHVVRSDATLEIMTATGSIQLRSTFVNESAIHEFLADPSRQTYVFRAAPYLIFVALIGGLGVFFLAIVVIGESLRLAGYKPRPATRRVAPSSKADNKWVKHVLGCVLLVVAVWVGSGVLRRRAERAIITELGGSVVTTSSSVSDIQVLLNATGVEFERGIGDEDLARLAPALKRYQKLKLDLSESSFTAAGLRHLADLKGLQSLNLSQCTVSAESLVEVAQLRGLVELNLSSCGVNDEGIAEIQQLPLLRVLYLHNSKLSDAGLRALGELSTLDYLLIGSDSISKEGVAELKSQLPRTEIHTFGARL